MYGHQYLAIPIYNKPPFVIPSSNRYVLFHQTLPVKLYLAHFVLQFGQIA